MPDSPEKSTVVPRLIEASLASAADTRQTMELLARGVIDRGILAETEREEVRQLTIEERCMYACVEGFAYLKRLAPPEVTLRGEKDRLVQLCLQAGEIGRSIHNKFVLAPEPYNAAKLTDEAWKELENATVSHIRPSLQRMYEAILPEIRNQIDVPPFSEALDRIVTYFFVNTKPKL